MDRKVRDFFPILNQKIHGHPLVYLDSAATTLKPLPVVEALSHFYLQEYGTVHRAVYSLSSTATEKYDQARKKVAAFINAPSPEQIIFTRGTTDGLNLVATILGRGVLQKGDEILITEMEHHSNIVPWQIVAAEKGAKLVVAPVKENGELDLQAFQKLLNPNTKVIAIAHVSNVLGTVNPIEEIVQMGHRNGSIVVVDGAQGAPHIPLDMQKIGCDFYAFSGHKLYGPNGIGILYGRKELLETLPPCQGGGDMIDTVTFEKTTYAAPPLKYEAGTPIIGQAIALGASIDFLSSLGLQKVGEHEHQLSEKFREGLKEFEEIKVIGEAAHRGAITSFVVKGAHPLDVGTLLDLEGIELRTGHLCAQPLIRKFGLNGVVRASFGLYNTSDEVDYLLSTLKRVTKKLTGTR